MARRAIRLSADPETDARPREDLSDSVHPSTHGRCRLQAADRSLLPTDESQMSAEGSARAGTGFGSTAATGPRGAASAGPALERQALNRSATMPLDLQPEGLRVQAAELRFMGRLSGVIDTPRAAKRLTNVYRLLRVSLTHEELTALLGTPGRLPEFPCVQLLLAVVVGFPTISSPLLRSLPEQRGDASWWALFEGSAPSGRNTRGRGSVTAWMRCDLSRFPNSPSSRGGSHTSCATHTSFQCCRAISAEHPSDNSPMAAALGSATSAGNAA